MEKGLFILSSPYFYTSILQSPCLLECFVGYIVMVILQVTHYQGESVAYKKNHVLCTPLFPGDYVRRLCSASMINNFCVNHRLVVVSRGMATLGSSHVGWQSWAINLVSRFSLFTSRFSFLAFHISYPVSRFSHLVSLHTLICHDETENEN